jgi:hypothetical protein
MSFFSSSANAMGTLLGGCFTGFASPVSMVCSTKWAVLSHSHSLKTRENISEASEGFLLAPL